VDAAVEGKDLELTVGVFPKRRNVELLRPLAIDDFGIDDGLASLLAEAHIRPVSKSP
jgi:hypothetical protein